MRILVTGACGFVGSTLIRGWVREGRHEIVGIDNFIRPGSEHNRDELRRLGVRLFHGDIRIASDLGSLPRADAVVDAAANPSVLAGVDGQSSSRQLVEHNLYGTVNVLEYCRRHGAAFVMLSTSRVYSIRALSQLPVDVAGDQFVLSSTLSLPSGVGPAGVAETFTTAAPVSLYGATKLASEQLALEYGETFGLPVWINRCGVLAGAGQFGRADQGIFSFWINSWLRRRALKYLGFEGRGWQVRDCLHPEDLLPLVEAQLAAATGPQPRVVNLSGGIDSACSLARLSAWCRDRIGEHFVESSLESRRFDIPWMVLDPSLARKVWDWRPSRPLDSILDEILAHALAHPDWLELSGSH